MATVGKRLLTDSTRLRALHRLDAASGPLAEGEGLAPAWLRAGVRGRRWRLDGTFALSAVALAVACLSLLLAAEAWRELGAPVGAPWALAVLLALLALVAVGVVHVHRAAAGRRRQAREAGLREAAARIEGAHGFARTLAVGLGEVRALLGAREATLVARERETGRGYRWMLPAEPSRDARAAFAGLDPAATDDCLFVAKADAWAARRRADGGWDVLALGADGAGVDDAAAVPEAALARLADRVGSSPDLAGFDIGVEAEWAGRVVVVEPRLGPQPEESLRVAQRLVRGMSGAVLSRYLLGRLRARVGAMERARIARDLHDSTIQSLVAVEMELELLRRRAEAHGSTPAGELARVQGLLHQEILDLRDTMQRLKPAEIEPSQLVGFLDAAVARFERESGIRALFDCAVQDVDLAPRVCREVARIVQEALQNVRKHSEARNVLVGLERAPSGWRLVVDDDGQGFAAFSGRLTHAELDQGRKGPYVIKERVRALGGELTISTLPGGGARLEILLPQEAP